MKKTIVMYSTVAVLCVVVMVVLSTVLPQATRSNQRFIIIVANYLFMFVLIGQSVLIYTEVKRMLSA